MIYYKCVRKKNGKLYSCTTFGRVYKYKLSKFINRRKNDGPFAVFDSFLNARKFLIDFFEFGEDYIIYECEIVKSNEQCLYTDRKGVRTAEELPEGTVFADKVMLTKEVFLYKTY